MRNSPYKIVFYDTDWAERKEVTAVDREDLYEWLEYVYEKGYPVLEIDEV